MKALKGMSLFGKSRGLRATLPKPPKLRTLQTLGEYDQESAERFDSWVDRVGETRAQEALRIWNDKTGSTTLPELLTEAALRKTGANYRAQLDLGWARPDFVVFDSDGATIIRVQGDYWHSRPGAVANDAQQADRLRRHTVFGQPVRRVVDIWEHDIYESESAVMGAFGFVPRADSNTPPPLLEWWQLAVTTPDVWGVWRFNAFDTQVSPDETGLHPGDYGAIIPSSVKSSRAGRKDGEYAQGFQTVTPGLNGATEWSVEGWAKLSSVVTMVLVQFGNTALPDNRVWLRNSAAGRNSVQVNGVDASDPQVWSLNWMYYVVRKRGTMAQANVNGQWFAPVTVANVATSSADIIRCAGVPVGAEYGGTVLMDDLAIYTRWLEDDEVAKHYAAD